MNKLAGSQDVAPSQKFTGAGRRTSSPSFFPRRRLLPPFPEGTSQMSRSQEWTGLKNYLQLLTVRPQDQARVAQRRGAVRVWGGAHLYSSASRLHLNVCAALCSGGRATCSLSLSLSLSGLPLSLSLSLCRRRRRRRPAARTARRGGGAGGSRLRAPAP